MCDRIVIRPQSAVTIAVNVRKVTKMKVIQQRKLYAHSDIGFKKLNILTNSTIAVLPTTNTIHHSITNSVVSG